MLHLLVFGSMKKDEILHMRKSLQNVIFVIFVVDGPAAKIIVSQVS